MDFQSKVFFLYYSPLDELPDSTILSIQTNGGLVNYTIHGTATNSTAISHSILQNISVFNDLNNKQIVISSENKQKLNIHYMMPLGI